MLGDFNGWSPLCGAQYCNDRGQIIQNFVLSFNLVNLNEMFQLTFQQMTLVPLSSSCLQNSDHFPKQRGFNLLPRSSPICSSIAKFNCDRADWG